MKLYFLMFFIILIVILVCYFIKIQQGIKISESFLSENNIDAENNLNISSEHNNSKVCKMTCTGENGENPYIGSPSSPSPEIHNLTGPNIHMCKRIGLTEGGNNYKNESNQFWFDAESKCLKDPQCASFTIEGSSKGFVKYYSNSIPVPIAPGKWKSSNYTNLYVKTDQPCLIDDKSTMANRSFNPKLINNFNTIKHDFFDNYFDNRLTQTVKDSNNNDISFLSQNMIPRTELSDGRWHLLGNGSLLQLAYDDQNNTIYGIGTDHKIWTNTPFSEDWSSFDSQSTDSYIKNWSTAYLEISDGQMYQLGFDGNVYTRPLVSGSREQLIARTIRAPLQAYNGRIYGIAFNPADFSIYSASLEGGVQPFQLLANSCCVIDFKIHNGIIYGVGTDHAVYMRSISEGSKWQRIGSPWVSKIIVYKDSIYGIGSNNWVYQLPIGGGSWRAVSNSCCVIDIIIVNGFMFGIGTNNRFYVKSLGTN